MKDYKHIEHMRNLNDSLIWERMKCCYNYGYEDGQKEKPQAIYEMKAEEYNKGLNEAWECAKKLCQSEKYGGLQEHCAEIFDRKDTFDVFDYSASEAIAKIKEYEEKQTEKSCGTCVHDVEIHEDFCKYCRHCVDYSKYKSNQTDDIKVGDEVIVQVDRIGFVTGFDVLFDRVYVTTKDGWSDAFGRSFVKKTGRHFDAIPEVLKQMNREEDK